MSGLFRVAARAEDLALFTRHLAGAMAARAPLHEILRAFARDSERNAMAAAADAMSDDVEAGMTLSESMERHADMFPAPYRRLVRVGEQGRALGGVMAQLAGTMESNLKTYELFRRAAIYPLIVSALLLLNVIFAYFFIVPKLVDLYETFGLSLASPLGFILQPEGIRFLLLAFIALLVVSVAFLTSTAMGLRLGSCEYGRGMLSLPMIGPVLRKAETARMANNLALMIENDVPLAEALGLVAEGSANSYARAALGEMARRFEQGERLSDLIAEQPLFPASLAVMVSSAEDRGGMVETFKAMGRFYDERASFGLAVLREVFEPLMLMLIGMLVGLLLLAVYGPMFYMPGVII